MSNDILISYANAVLRGPPIMQMAALQSTLLRTSNDDIPTLDIKCSTQIRIKGLEISDYGEVQ